MKIKKSDYKIKKNFSKLNFKSEKNNKTKQLKKKLHNFINNILNKILLIN